MDENNISISNEISNHRKMLATPALKILADLDHSEKSFIVLISVMDRCCKETNNQGVFIGASIKNNERKLGLAFTKWFLGRFSVIFTRKTLNKAFNSFIELHVKILNLFCDKEPSHFVLLINEYVQLLKELVEVSCKRFKGEICDNEKVKLTAFATKEAIELAPDCSLSMEGLELESITECVLLQLNITKILTCLGGGIVQYHWHQCDKLAWVILQQLDFGGADLFAVSLRCLGCLLQNNCSRLVLNIVLNFCHRLTDLLTDTVQMNLCSENSVLGINNEMWSDIKLALVQCLKPLSLICSGMESAKNHEYLWLVSYIAQHREFCCTVILDYLLPSMLISFSKFQCPRNIVLFQFTTETYIRFLSSSETSVPLLVNLVGRELSLSDGPPDIEPTAKRPKMDFLTSSSIWDQIKRYLDTLLSNESLSVEDIRVVIRIAVVGARLSLKWKDSGTVFEERNYQKINVKLAEHLLLGINDGSEEIVQILCEYLDGCIPLTYSGIEKMIGIDWLAFSALPWLSMGSCDLDPKWLRIHHILKHSLLKHQSRFANAFVRFPSSYFKPWVAEISCQILGLDFVEVGAEFMIQSLSWISRHGKIFRDPLINYITKILASGSSELISELTRNGSDIICSLSGKTNVVNNPEDGLSLRCNHHLEGTCALKLSTVSEDISLFFLELVFDENDHSVSHRTQLFRSILCHSAHTENLRLAMLKQLRSITQKSIAHNKVILQRTVLKCFRILIQVWKDAGVADYLHVIFQLMLSSYSSLMICWISSTLRDIAADLNVTTEILFNRNIQVVCQVLLSNSDIEWRTNFISLAPEIFQLTCVPHWLYVMLPTLVPKLVIESISGPNLFLDEICTILNKSRSEIMAKYFANIYVYLLLHSSQHEKTVVIEHIESITGLKLVQLRAPNFQSVHNDLLLQLHSNRERVLEALSGFVCDDKVVSKNRKTLENIGDYLRPRFLGILVHLDSILVSKTVSDHIKVEALSSLSDVLHLMGAENIMAVRLKVLATLRTALQLNHATFPQLNATAWESFVRNVSIQQLGPLISQITVSVLPLYQCCSEQIRSILYYIVIENAEELKDHLRDLHFLPERPGLEDIVYSLKQSSLANNSVPEQLSLIIRNISHEDLEVRLQSLIHLKTMVQQNPATIQKLIMGTNETSDTVITRLVSSLLKGCSVREEELLVLYGQCFGYLGAIDPGRLTFTDQHHGDSTVYTVNLIDDEFTFHLLGILARSFLAPRNAQTLNFLSFTIQEILKIYSSEDDPGKLKKSALWNRFAEHLRVAFTPLTSSRYVLKQQQHQTNQIPFPVYRSAVGKTYSTWLYNWSCKLIAKVTHSLAKEIFTACLPTVRRDVHVNLFILPYVVITALWSGTLEDRVKIKEEIMAVLNDHGLQKSPKRMMKRFSSNASTTDASSQNSCEKDSADLDLHQTSMQAIFYLLDHMKKWLKQKLGVHRSKKERQTAIQDQEYKVVLDLLDDIPNDLLARASYQCLAYARAVLHLETYLKSNPNQLKDQLGFLQKLYVALDEPDGVAGVCAIRDHEPSLEENITAYEATGRLQDAFSCYERISQRDDCSLEFYQGMLRCLLNLDLPQGALTMANGLLQNCPDWRRNLDDYRAECCWRLGQWDTLEDVVKTYDIASAASKVGWGIGLGQALLATKSNDLSRMENHLRAVRLGQMRMISAVNLERNSYPRAYESFVKLHILSEMESAVPLLESGSKESVFRSRLTQLLQNWDAGLDGVQASVRFMEPILNMRRVVLKLIGQQLEAKQPELTTAIEMEIGKSWLVSARLARKANHFQRAHILQLVASTSACPPLAIYMEQAKLHWAKGEQDQAITVLKRGIEKRFPDLAAFKSTNQNVDPTQLSGDIYECLKAKLLLARYYDQTGNADMSSIIQYYKEVVEINKQWEEGWFYLAQYYDRLWNSLEVKDSHGDVARYIITNLGRSMQHGSNYIYQAMPRMLSLWMELGTIEIENSKTSKANAKVRLAEITKMLAGFLEIIPAYKFLTAFPQLISRICHPHPDVASMLRRIIAKILIAYPQQSMWMMVSVMKSSYSVRAKRCKEIIDVATSTEPSLRIFFSDSTNLVDRLVDLANKHVENGVMTLSIAKSFKMLPKLLSGLNFSKIMIPLQWTMNVTLPMTLGSHLTHNPFPRDPVYIVGVDDTVEVMHSLQKPKKISLRGSDGLSYVFLCKPKDDLRKDFRLMEFNQLINRYLVKDPESRKRNLHIRTYAVIPLNEECGLIEWIPNLIGLRHILNKIYKEKGLVTSNTDLKRLMPQLRDTLARKKEIFQKELLRRHPSVLSEWFLTTFPDPQDWFSARLSYVRTLAVMSMVGFVVGLGDRHGENILFDSGCGDAVHVDLSCLFNKGETFEWPEKVPFRLTHNMIEAMGSTGIEGSYRKCCEVTLRVLRTQSDTLLSVLKPFVHDPLVEWSKPSSKGRTDLGEIKNEQALEHVGNIEQRLQGFLHSKAKTKIINLPLSVEGQVNQLISEATSVDNLAQMYIGWAAYM